MVKQKNTGFAAITRHSRPIALFLAILLVFSTVCIASAADKEPTPITSGDYQYVVLDDGTAEITKYTGSEASLTIPTELDGIAVTSIGKFSFEKCTSITSLTIPGSLKSIGKNAFRYCTFNTT